MNARGRWCVFFGLVSAGSLIGGGTGCGGTKGAGGSGEESVCSPAPERLPPQAGDLFPDDDRHWILKDPSGVCASVSHWEGRPLFTGSIKGTKLSGKVAEYCGYTWTGGAPAIVGDLPLGKKAKDLAELTPQAQSVGDWAHQTFLDGISLPTMAPSGSDPRVRVIVADTEGDSIGEGGGGSGAGTNLHGMWMKDLVQEVACRDLSPGSCTVEVETRLALPLIRNPISHEEEMVKSRGECGRPSNLLEAINRALSRWYGEIDQAIIGNARLPEMLVLNLSIASEGGVPLSEDEDFQGNEVILVALKAFSCHGGVIFAAAGNHGGSGSSGLMYPAAWQDEAEPTDEECKALLGEPGNDFFALLKKSYSDATGGVLRRPYVPTLPETNGKLLHAVGAVDRGGMLIQSSREDACPGLVAMGFGWTVPGTTDLLVTGTSVPTAVVAGLYGAIAAQDTFPGSVVPPYLGVHPRAILDSIVQASPQIPRFAVEGPCGKPWSCPVNIRWIGAPTETVAVTTPGNDGYNFPWSSYLDGGWSSPLTAQNNRCTQLPLCERSASSAVSLLFPQPTFVPCLNGCIFYKANKSIFINPADDLSRVKFRLALPGYNEIFDLTTDQLPSLDRMGRYTFKLPDGWENFPSEARASISGFDPRGNSFIEQVLVVE